MLSSDMSAKGLQGRQCILVDKRKRSRAKRYSETFCLADCEVSMRKNKAAFVGVVCGVLCAACVFAYTQAVLG